MKVVMHLTLYSIAYPVTALGPGNRLVLWVSGCPMRCKDCITPELLSESSGKQISIERLIKHILSLSVHIDGVTLTGGEPFHQAKPLALFIDRLRQHRPQWDILFFSGFKKSQLEKKDDDVIHLLGQIDILVDGPFVSSLPSQHPLLASSNQTIHYLSERGLSKKSQIDGGRSDFANLAIGNETHDLLVGIIDASRRVQSHYELGISPYEATRDGM